MGKADELLLGLAKQRYGVVAIRQALKLGVTREQLEHRRRRGGWQRVLPDVLRAPWAADTFEARSAAASLWAGPDALVSHAAAGRLWKLDGVRTDTVHVSAPYRLFPPRSWVITHEARAFPCGLRRLRGGVPVTSPARTLVDLAADPGVDLEALVEQAVRARLTTARELESALEAVQPRGRAGSARLRRLLRERHPDADRLGSELERCVLSAVRGGRLPSPACQFGVELPGYRLATVDFAWPAQRVAVEADSYTFHSGRRAWARDLERHNALTAAGWRTLRVTWSEVHDAPLRVVARLQELLHSTFR